MSYANLHEAKRALKAIPTSSAEDMVLKQFLNAATRRAENRMGFTFEPYWETKYIELYRQTMDLVSSIHGTLRLPGPLLEFESATKNGTALSGVSTFGPPPWREIRLNNPACQSWYACDTPFTTITVWGGWGTGRYYLNQHWYAVDAVQNAGGILAGTTVIEVNSVSANDPFGLPQRFSWGQLVRLDDEYARITDVAAGGDGGFDMITVRRAENGTTAVAHDENTPIEVHYVDEDLRNEIARQAGLLYARRGSFEKVSVSDMGVVSYPQDLLASLLGVLQEYAND